MAGLFSNLLFLTIQYAILDCTKRTLRSVYKPYGPKMCQQFCQDFTDTFYFRKEDLSCHRISTVDPPVSLKQCLREERGMNDRNVFTPQTGLNVCINHHEDVHRPSLLHFTTGASHGRDAYSGHISHNITLHRACEEGRLCMVQSILSRTPTDINTRDKLGRTPIMAAAMKQQVAVFDFLVSQGCDLMAVDNSSDTVLHVACDGGSVDIVTQLVVNHTCNIESRGGKGMTPVMRSALHGHRDVFDLLVSKDCNVTTLDDNMNNILHVACSGGHVEMVKYVLRKFKFAIESRGKKERTPVMIAAHSGHLEVFAFLTSEGSNLFATDSYKYNILHLACINGHVHMVQHILNKNLTDIDIKAQYGWTPVMSAVRYGQMSVVSFLVKEDCNLSGTDNYMNTMLHIACMSGNVDMVKYIFLHTVIGKESRGAYGRTPVVTAAGFGHVAVVKYLVSKGCKLSAQDSLGNTILHVACMSGNVDMVKYIFLHTKLGKESRGAYGRTPVMTAAEVGHVAVVRYLVSTGCKLSAHDYQGNTILHVACISGNVDMVNHIVLHTKIEKESRGEYGRTPVMTAASFGRMAVVKYLVSKGCNMSVQDSQGDTILHVACMSGNVDMVKYIFTQTKFGKESRNAHRRTPVMSAVRLGHMAVVKYLVSKGCKLSAQDLQGNTILHAACMSGNVDMVKYIFLHTKIGKESRGGYGRTPVMTAANLGHVAVVKYLERKGCKLSVQDSQRSTILHVACMSGNVDMVKYIFTQTNIGIESRGTSGWTPVMTTASVGRIAIVKYLVSKGCKLSTQDSQGNTILHAACMSGNVDMVKYIFTQTKIEIESRGAYGRTPVMTAAGFGHVAVVKFLVSKGCKLSTRDSQRNTILHVACMSGNEDMVKYIFTQTKVGIETRGAYGRTPVMTAAFHGHMAVVRYLVGKRCKLSTVDVRGMNILQVACTARHDDVIKYLITLESWSTKC